MVADSNMVAGQWQWCWFGQSRGCKVGADSGGNVAKVVEPLVYLSGHGRGHEGFEEF